MATAHKFIQLLRNFLSGHNLQGKLNNRLIQDVVSRNVPAANLPEGPSHKLSANYYLSRDGRREVEPPTVIYDQTKRLAPASGGENAIARKPVTPGLGPFKWEISKDQPYL